MNKNLGISILIVILLGAGGYWVWRTNVQNSEEVIDTSNWVTFTNTKHLYTLKYPQGVVPQSEDFGEPSPALSTTVSFNRISLVNGATTRTRAFWIEARIPGDQYSPYVGLTLDYERNYPLSEWASVVHNFFLTGPQQAEGQESRIKTVTSLEKLVLNDEITTFFFGFETEDNVGQGGVFFFEHENTLFLLQAEPSHIKLTKEILKTLRFLDE